MHLPLIYFFINEKYGDEEKKNKIRKLLFICHHKSQYYLPTDGTHAKSYKRLMKNNIFFSCAGAHLFVCLFRSALRCIAGNLTPEKQQHTHIHISIYIFSPKK